MVNPVIVNNDNGSIIVEGSADRRDTFTAPASVVPSGTILARLTATGKLVVFVKGGAGGAEIPKAVLTYAVDGGAGGDVPIDSFVSGKVNSTRLIIAADGDASNVDAVVLDQLQDYGIVAVPVAQANILDNQ